MKSLKILIYPSILSPSILVGIVYFFSSLLIFEILISLFVQISLLILIYCLIVFTAGFLIKNKKIIIINSLNLIIFLLCLVNISQTYFRNYYVEVEGKNIKVLSANILYSNDNYAEIFNLIEKNNPDVIIFIEYTDTHQSTLFDELARDYPYYVDNLTNPIGRNVIYSKQPIEHTNTDLNKYFATSVKFTNSNVELIAIHPPAPIAPRYFSNRNEFFDNLASYLESSENLNIVAGDYNLSPFSPYYRKFNSRVSEKLYNPLTSDSPKCTWEFFGIPGVNSHIDHFFVDREIASENCKIESFKGSDHDAIMCEFTIQQ